MTQIAQKAARSITVAARIRAFAGLLSSMRERESISLRGEFQPPPSTSSLRLRSGQAGQALRGLFSFALLSAENRLDNV